VRDGSPVYAWPFEQRHVWRAPTMPVAGPGARARHTGSLKPKLLRGRHRRRD